MIADSSNAAATAAGATLSANLGIPTGKQEPVLVSQAFGEMVYVLTQSPVHRHMFVADLEWLLLPPILAGTIRIFRDKDGKGPAAFAIWALVSDEVHERLKSANLAAGPLRLQPNEWLSGTNIWLM